MSDKPKILDRDVEGDEQGHYYHYEYVCLNCRHVNPRYVLKGTWVSELSIKCDNCGCKVDG